MNKHVVSRRWFTETDVKHFKSGALKKMTNIAHKEHTPFHCKLKKFFCLLVYVFIDTEQYSEIGIFSLVFFQDFVDRFRTAYLNISLKVFFKNFVDGIQNSYLSKKWINSKVYLKGFCT